MNELELQLNYPFGDTLPATGTTLEVAPGVRWLRMELPFQLNHINLWLLRDEIDAVLPIAQQPQVDVVERERQRHAQPAHAGRDFGRGANGRQSVAQGVVQAALVQVPHAAPYIYVYVNVNPV